MNEFICFPVDFDEKERFQRLCRSLDLKPEEWFRRAVIESELELAARKHPDQTSTPHLEEDHPHNKPESNEGQK